jgi:hypothetical protein
MNHTIAVLHAPGCHGGAAALETASEIAGERDDVIVADVVIEDDASAVAQGFRGSPTVVIDGREMAPDPHVPIGTMG